METELLQDRLFPCPYSKAVNCTLVDPCKGCETWAKYLAGEEVPRFNDPRASGLLDRNGREIMEGDKTREWLEDNMSEGGGFFNHGTVRFYKGAFCWFENGFDYDAHGEEPHLLREIASDVEVI